ncbi:aldo/keto reductase [Solibaculum mannosilyticum]|uniref:Aldo/keto reductase n=1 Tax=Solibaculum mannosilyticum TaxID=2780922 RepID=A0A7I8D853_9FIRM|nr:aldo/keto reductase [Solibaculum mannosilyticum]BCI60814.1 aldo/keto reductase [Solibaculum mannosilyticum]
MAEKRKLRNLEVSPIGMGCMGFSHGYGKVPERNYSIQAIRKAANFGCTFFDTAESYGKEQFYPGHNEELVGEALEPFRKDVILATKLHLDTAEISAGNTLYEVMRRHLELSMQRLKTDYIDLYYLHRLNEQIPIEDVAEVMGKFIQNGFIRGWGLSQVSIQTLDTANQVTPVTAVQSLYSMVERGLEQEIIPYCLEHDIGLVPFSPIASGFLSGKVTAKTKFEGDDVRKFVPQLSKENLAANQPILDILAELSAKKNATSAQISLAWMLYKYPNVVPIPGSKNQERILENLASWNVNLSAAEFQALETALDHCTVYGQRGYVESEQNSFGHNWSKKNY